MWIHHRLTFQFNYMYDNILYACVGFAFKNYDATKTFLGTTIYEYTKSKKKIQFENKKNKTNHYNTRVLCDRFNIGGDRYFIDTF